jgi:hypothetical protein
MKAKATKKGAATRGSALWDEAMLKAQVKPSNTPARFRPVKAVLRCSSLVDVGHSIEL